MMGSHGCATNLLDNNVVKLCNVFLHSDFNGINEALGRRGFDAPTFKDFFACPSVLSMLGYIASIFHR